METSRPHIAVGSEQVTSHVDASKVGRVTVLQGAINGNVPRGMDGVVPQAYRHWVQSGWCCIASQDEPMRLISQNDLRVADLAFRTP